MYNSLHVHTTEGSIGDSILKVNEALIKAKELGMTALAVTDHGGVSNLINFYKASIDKDINVNIKPIFGMEAYEAHDRTNKSQKENCHLLLLAKNNKGFLDLLKIASDSSLLGFYYKPRTDMSILKKYGKDIIGMSACVGGRIPCIIKEIYDIQESDLIKARKNMIIKIKEDKIIKLIDEYKSCFAEFYLELQPGDFKLQVYTNQYLVKLAGMTNTPLVITNDVHYLNAEDYMAHNYHVKLSRDSKSDMLDKDKLEYPDKCYYLMGYDDIRKRFNYIDENIIEEALANTIKISDSITTNLKEIYDGIIKMPLASTNKQRSEYEELAYQSYIGFQNKFNNFSDPSVYADRVKYELDTLNEVGFCGYLLIIKDIIEYANDNNIPIGPGRGSIAGSLVAYLIGITKVDPIKYDLMFERFISRYRKGSVPDVDLDSGSSCRHMLFKYVANKYGERKCALVSTFMMRKAKLAIQDSARLLGISRAEAVRVSKLIPKEYYRDDDEQLDKETNLSLSRSYEVDKKFQNEMDKNPEWFAVAKLIENLPKATSIHAAGTLISSIDLINYIPLIRNGGAKNKSPLLEMATSLDLKKAEFCGAIKYDFLGISTLDIANRTENEVSFIPDYTDDKWYNDIDVWKLIGSVHTTTLFQIGSKIYKERMFKLKPKSIEELSHCLALVRGPCIQSKLDIQYINVLNGKKEIKLIHPFYDEITRPTNGVLLYQEQVIDILINFGFDAETAFKIMKMATKKNDEAMLKYEPQFMKLAAERNVTEAIAKQIWKIIYDTYKYSFNKSHGISYAMLCYNTAYLRIHYSLEWLKNALTNAYERAEEIEETINECRNTGIKFLPVDINKSKYEFTIEDGKIRFGFIAVKSVGIKSYNSINANRPYNSVENFIFKSSNIEEDIEAEEIIIEEIGIEEDIEEISVKEVSNNYNKTNIVNTILSGALESFGENRIDTIQKYCNSRNEMSINNGILTISEKNKIKLNDLMAIDKLILGTTALSTPANNFKEFNFDKLKDGANLCVEAIIINIFDCKDRNNNPMISLTIDTYYGYINAIVFHKYYNQLYEIIHNNMNKTVMVTGSKCMDYNNIQVTKIDILE